MVLGFFQGKKYLFFLALYFGDVIMFLISAWAASAIVGLDLANLFYPRFYLFCLLIMLVNYSAYGLYKEKRNLFDDNDFMNLLYSNFLTYFITLVFILMFDPGDAAMIAASSLLILFNIALASVARFLIFQAVYYFRKKGLDHRKVIFYGEGNEEFVQKITENPRLGYDVIKSTADFDVLKRYLKKVDIVFVSKEHIDEKMLDLMIQYDMINWKIIPHVLNLVIDPVSFDEFRDYPIINISNNSINTRYLITKRIMDILLSGISLIVLSPLFLLIAIIIKLTSKGPVFFKQERLGRHLEPFVLYKFRSMVVDAEEKKAKLMAKNEVKGIFKIKDDPRITKIGKLLRRSNIDELPQLINVFKGEMSLVGPRPHLESELDNFKGWRRARFKVKPGLTGLWQVNGRHELNFDKAMLYDIYYIKHMSFVVDITIIIKTIPSILMSRGKH